MATMLTSRTLRSMALVAAAKAGKSACVHTLAASAPVLGLGSERIRPYTQSGIRIAGSPVAGTQEWQNDPRFSTDTGVLAGGPPMS